MTPLHQTVRRGLQQIGRVLLLLIGLTAVGVLGFRFIEGGSWLDCFYMTVITLSTVGYEHVIRPSDAGKIFIALYLISGLGVFTYSAFTLGQWVVSIELRQFWERRRMERTIEDLRGHYIVCGFGRMGRLICEELAVQRAPFVVIEKDSAAVSACIDRGWLHIVGEATDDEVLQAAGITRAAAVAAALPSDADNVYVSLSARMLAPNVRVIARATEERVAEKLRRAGADRVVSPLTSGAVKVARFLVNPDLEDLLDIAEGFGEGLELADVRIPHESTLVGKRLDQTTFKQSGLTVLCIRRKDGTRIVTPTKEVKIGGDDLLFLFGAESAVRSATHFIATS